MGGGAARGQAESMKGTLLSPSSQPLTHAPRSGSPGGRAGTGRLPVGGAQTPPEKHSTDLVCAPKPFSSTRPPALNSQAALPAINHTCYPGLSLPQTHPLSGQSSSPAARQVHFTFLYPEKPRAANTFPPEKGPESHSPPTGILSPSLGTHPSKSLPVWTPGGTGAQSPKV